jgi:hypothetical protein
MNKIKLLLIVLGIFIITGGIIGYFTNSPNYKSSELIPLLNKTYSIGSPTNAFSCDDERIQNLNYSKWNEVWCKDENGEIVNLKEPTFNRNPAWENGSLFNQSTSIVIRADEIIFKDEDMTIIWNESETAWNLSAFDKMVWKIGNKTYEFVLSENQEVKE